MKRKLLRYMIGLAETPLVDALVEISDIQDKYNTVPTKELGLDLNIVKAQIDLALSYLRLLK